MVRDRLREEECASQHGLGFSAVASHARDKWQHGVVERFVVQACGRVEACERVEVIAV